MKTQVTEQKTNSDISDIKSPLNEVLPAIARAVASWKQTHTPEVVTANVNSLLDANSKRITMSLLGFNDSYGHWTIDYNKDFNNYTPVGDYIKKANCIAIKEFLDNFKPPVLSKTELNKISADFKYDFKEELTRKLRIVATRLIEEQLKEIMDELTSSSAAEQYLKLVALIDGNSTKD